MIVLYCSLSLLDRPTLSYLQFSIRLSFLSDRVTLSHGLLIMNCLTLNPARPKQPGPVGLKCGHAGSASLGLAGVQLTKFTKKNILTPLTYSVVKPFVRTDYMSYVFTSCIFSQPFRLCTLLCQYD